MIKLAVKRTEDEIKQLLSQGHSQYDINNMTNDELNRIAQARTAAKAAANGGKVDWSAANNIAESIRKNYNYSLGSKGDTYKELAKAASTPTTTSTVTPVVSKEAPTYVSQYADAINTLKNSILNREAFSYDYNADPSYQAYKKQYTREGQRATADTLGQAAALTGGMASTAAVNAASQAGDYYAAQLSDKIPELRQAAYSMYQDEGNTMRNNLSTLLNLENADYSKYQDQLSQYNIDRNYDYQTYQDALAQENWQKQFDYQQAADALAQQNWQTQFDYTKSQDALAQENYLKELALQQYKAYNSGNGTNETVDNYTLYDQVKAVTGQTNIFTPEQFNRQTFMQDKYGTYENYCKSVLSNYGISYDQLSNKIANMQAKITQGASWDNDFLKSVQTMFPDDIDSQVNYVYNYLDNMDGDNTELFKRYANAFGYTQKQIDQFVKNHSN